MTNDIANMPSPPGLRLPWAGKMVRIEQVEEVLASLWKMSVDNVRVGVNLNVRTSVLNLVICTPDIETAQYASQVLRDLSSTHLARVIILILDSSAGASSSISAWVILRCFPVISDLMRHCYEQTTMLASGSPARSIANIIQPLLKPDLPVYLWWLGDPPDENDPAFKGLVELSNRMVFDSTGFFHPEQDIYTLASLCQAAPDCALSDLNWGRLTPWRQLVIQFFDVPEYRPFLDGIQSIEIEHAAAPLALPMRTEEGEVSPNPTRALLLAGWLKSRLGWRLAADTSNNYHDTTTGTYLWYMERPPGAHGTRQFVSPRSLEGRQGGGQQASISIRPQIRPELRPGSISLVRLISTFENKQAIFTISRGDDLDHVFTSVELEHETRSARTVSLAAVHKESQLLHDELEITGHDYSFEETLQEVAKLLAS